MIVSFRDQATEDIYNGESTKAGRGRLPQELWRKAQVRLAQLNAAVNVKDMAIPKGNQLHPLEGDRAGQWSVRINDQYRVCFRFEEGAHDVEIIDYH